MLKIRLQRVGRKHEPVFRLVVVNSHRGPKSGKFIEILGSYDSRRGEKAEFKEDRIKHWISVGAQTSGTVHNILISKKIIEGKKVNVLPKKKPIKKDQQSETSDQQQTEIKTEEEVLQKDQQPEEKEEERVKEASETPKASAVSGEQKQSESEKPSEEGKTETPKDEENPSQSAEKQGKSQEEPRQEKSANT